MRQFLRIGHFPTLLGAFLHFDVSFMVWVLLGALGVFIAQDLQLSPAQKGLVAAVPILGGSLFRIPVGFLADRYGPKRVGSVTMLLTLVPLALGWLFATSLSQVLLVGILLGVAGASFAVSLPLASRWYPAEYQGIVMGIAGAGNSGTVLANLFAPRLAEHVGWHGVMALAMLPVLLVGLVFIAFAKDSPTQPAPISLRRFVGVLGKADAWWFCLFYSITFGGFVGLSSFLPIFFFDQYGIARVDAGSLTALCVFGGSLFRPLGGLLADRFGGITVLSGLYLAIAGLMIGVAQLPAVSVVTPLLILGMFSLGMGNGAVFQLVPQRFGREIGAMTGIVGAAGGLGGFVLPSLLGLLKEQLGTYGAGFLVLAAAALIALSALRLLNQFEAGWRTVWQGRATAQPGARPILAE